MYYIYKNMLLHKKNRLAHRNSRSQPRRWCRNPNLIRKNDAGFGITHQNSKTKTLYALPETAAFSSSSRFAFYRVNLPIVCFSTFTHTRTYTTKRLQTSNAYAHVFCHQMGHKLPVATGNQGDWQGYRQLGLKCFFTSEQETRALKLVCAAHPNRSVVAPDKAVGTPQNDCNRNGCNRGLFAYDLSNSILELRYANRSKPYLETYVRKTRFPKSWPKWQPKRASKPTFPHSIQDKTPTIVTEAELFGEWKTKQIPERKMWRFAFSSFILLCFVGIVAKKQGNATKGFGIISNLPLPALHHTFVQQGSWHGFSAVTSKYLDRDPSLLENVEIKQDQCLVNFSLPWEKQHQKKFVGVFADIDDTFSALSSSPSVPGSPSLMPTVDFLETDSSVLVETTNERVSTIQNETQNESDSVADSRSVFEPNGVRFWFEDLNASHNNLGFTNELSLLQADRKNKKKHIFSPWYRVYASCPPRRIEGNQFQIAYDWGVRPYFEKHKRFTQLQHQNVSPAKEQSILFNSRQNIYRNPAREKPGIAQPSRTLVSTEKDRNQSTRSINYAQYNNIESKNDSIPSKLASLRQWDRITCNDCTSEIAEPALNVNNEKRPTGATVARVLKRNSGEMTKRVMRFDNSKRTLILFQERLQRFDDSCIPLSGASQHRFVSIVRPSLQMNPAQEERTHNSHSDLREDRGVYPENIGKPSLYSYNFFVQPVDEFSDLVKEVTGRSLNKLVSSFSSGSEDHEDLEQIVNYVKNLKPNELEALRQAKKEERTLPLPNRGRVLTSPRSLFNVSDAVDVPNLESAALQTIANEQTFQEETDHTTSSEPGISSESTASFEPRGGEMGDWSGAGAEVTSLGIQQRESIQKERSVFNNISQTSSLNKARQRYMRALADKRLDLHRLEEARQHYRRARVNYVKSVFDRRESYEFLEERLREIFSELEESLFRQHNQSFKRGRGVTAFTRDFLQRLQKTKRPLDHQIEEVDTTVFANDPWEMYIHKGNGKAAQDLQGAPNNVLSGVANKKSKDALVWRQYLEIERLFTLARFKTQNKVCKMPTRFMSGYAFPDLKKADMSRLFQQSRALSTQSPKKRNNVWLAPLQRIGVAPDLHRTNLDAYTKHALLTPIRILRMPFLRFSELVDLDALRLRQEQATPFELKTAVSYRHKHNDRFSFDRVTWNGYRGMLFPAAHNAEHKSVQHQGPEQGPGQETVLYSPLELNEIEALRSFLDGGGGQEIQPSKPSGATTSTVGLDQRPNKIDRTERQKESKAPTYPGAPISKQGTKLVGYYQDLVSFVYSQANKNPWCFKDYNAFIASPMASTEEIALSKSIEKDQTLEGQNPLENREKIAASLANDDAIYLLASDDNENEHHPDPTDLTWVEGLKNKVEEKSKNARDKMYAKKRGERKKQLEAMLAKMQEPIVRDVKSKPAQNEDPRKEPVLQDWEAGSTLEGLSGLSQEPDLQDRQAESISGEPPKVKQELASHYDTKAQLKRNIEILKSSTQLERLNYLRFAEEEREKDKSAPVIEVKKESKAKGNLKEKRFTNKLPSLSNSIQPGLSSILKSNSLLKDRKHSFLGATNLYPKSKKQLDEDQELIRSMIPQDDWTHFFNASWERYRDGNRWVKPRDRALPRQEARAVDTNNGSMLPVMPNRGVGIGRASMGGIDNGNKIASVNSSPHALSEAPTSTLPPSPIQPVYGPRPDLLNAYPPVNPETVREKMYKELREADAETDTPSGDGMQLVAKKEAEPTKLPLPEHVFFASREKTVTPGTDTIKHKTDRRRKNKIADRPDPPKRARAEYYETGELKRYANEDEKRKDQITYDVLGTPSTQYIVMPQASRAQWRKLIENQFKMYQSLERYRLEPLLEQDPSQHFKLKKFVVRLPWIERKTPSENAFYWPVTRLDYKTNLILREQSKDRTNTVLDATSKQDWAQAFDGRSRHVVEGELSALGASRLRDQHNSIENDAMTPKNGASYGSLVEPNWQSNLNWVAHWPKNSYSLQIKERSRYNSAKTDLRAEAGNHTVVLFERAVGYHLPLLILAINFYLACLVKPVVRALQPLYGRYIEPTIENPKKRSYSKFLGFLRAGLGGVSRYRVFSKLPIGLDDLPGNEMTMSECSKLAMHLKNNYSGYMAPRGVVLVEPPNSDNTILLQAIAGEARVPMIIQSLAKMANARSPQYALARIMRYARKIKPCILFFTDLDVIGQSRENLVQSSENGSALAAILDNKIYKAPQNWGLTNGDLNDLLNSFWVPSRSDIWAGDRSDHKTGIVQKMGVKSASRYMANSLNTLETAVPPSASQLYFNQLAAKSIESKSAYLYLTKSLGFSQNQSQSKGAEQAPHPNEFTGLSATRQSNTSDPNRYVERLLFASNNVILQKPRLYIDLKHDPTELKTVSREDEERMIEASRIKKRRTNLMLRLLIFMDGVTRETGILIAANTKDLFALDPALRRAGRFEKVIHVSPPSKKTRLQFLQTKTSKIGYSRDIPWHYIAARTANMDAQRLVSVLEHSTFKAALDNTCHTLLTLEYAIDLVRRVPGSIGRSTTDPTSGLDYKKAQHTAPRDRGIRKVGARIAIWQKPANNTGTIKGGEMQKKPLYNVPSDSTLVTQQAFGLLRLNQGSAVHNVSEDAVIAFYAAGKAVIQALLLQHPELVFLALPNYAENVTRRDTSVDTERDTHRKPIISKMNQGRNRSQTSGKKIMCPSLRNNGEIPLFATPLPNVQPQLKLQLRAEFQLRPDLEPRSSLKPFWRFGEQARLVGMAGATRRKRSLSRGDSKEGQPRKRVTATARSTKDAWNELRLRVMYRPVREKQASLVIGTARESNRYRVPKQPTESFKLGLPGQNMAQRGSTIWNPLLFPSSPNLSLFKFKTDTQTWYVRTSTVLRSNKNKYQDLGGSTTQEQWNQQNEEKQPVFSIGLRLRPRLTFPLRFFLPLQPAFVSRPAFPYGFGPTCKNRQFVNSSVDSVWLRATKNISQLDKKLFLEKRSQQTVCAPWSKQDISARLVGLYAGSAAEQLYLYSTVPQHIHSAPIGISPDPTPSSAPFTEEAENVRNPVDHATSSDPLASVTPLTEQIVAKEDSTERLATEEAAIKKADADQAATKEATAEGADTKEADAEEVDAELLEDLTKYADSVTSPDRTSSSTTLTKKYEDLTHPVSYQTLHSNLGDIDRIRASSLIEFMITNLYPTQTNGVSSSVLSSLDGPNEQRDRAAVGQGPDKPREQDPVKAVSQEPAKEILVPQDIYKLRHAQPLRGILVENTPSNAESSNTARLGNEMYNAIEEPKYSFGRWCNPHSTQQQIRTSVDFLSTDLFLREHMPVYNKETLQAGSNRARMIDNNSVQKNRSVFDHDFAHYNMTIQSFYKAFNGCCEHRELLDMLADHLFRFQTLRSYEIRRICLFFI